MKIMTRHPILAIAALLLVGCSSPQEAERLNKEGYVRGAIEESERVLADSEGLTPEQVERAKAIRDAARERLIKFYVTLINQELLGERFQDALTNYETALSEYPEIGGTPDLGRRVMRAYVRVGQLSKARETASLLLASNPDPAARAEADAFIEQLTALEEARESRESLTQRVELIGSSIGVDFVNVAFRPSCIIMNETERLTPESAKVVEDYFAAVTTENGIQSELGIIPSIVY
jgi:tetratricopeptide (TPR) repeat protein